MNIETEKNNQLDIIPHIPILFRKAPDNFNVCVDRNRLIYSMYIMLSILPDSW